MSEIEFKGDTTDHCCSDKEQECQEFKKVATLLYAMIDGETTDQERQFVINHIEYCIDCFELMKVEKEVLGEIKTKLERKVCPQSLLESVKGKIKSLSV